MPDIKPTTVEQYLKAVPEDRRAAIQAVREVFRKNLDPKYEEGIQYGGIGYYIPHSIYPAGYHCDPKQPLPFGGIANRKGYMTVGLFCIYGRSEDFKKRWVKTGKKLDMGAGCIRFKKLDDLALDVLAETIRKIPVSEFIYYYENVMRGASHKDARKPSGMRPTAKKPSRKARKK
ncbi:MAG: DUF1801 domain-containing protein [Planctomycetes bacterium]|nr:DUF1801 domain-containing protein [Planctomycetota bacterium]